MRILTLCCGFCVHEKRQEAWFFIQKVMKNHAFAHLLSSERQHLTMQKVSFDNAKDYLSLHGESPFARTPL
jgi:hypothetical protein